MTVVRLGIVTVARCRVIAADEASVIRLDLIHRLSERLLEATVGEDVEGVSLTDNESSTRLGSEGELLADFEE